MAPAPEYLVDSIADAEQALSHPLLSPTVLLHQPQQHRAAGFSNALLLVVIHLVQMDFELRIGPVSGWRRRFPPKWGEEIRKNRTKGGTLIIPVKAQLAHLCRSAGLGKFSLQGGRASPLRSPPRPHTRRHPHTHTALGNSAPCPVGQLGAQISLTGDIQGPVVSGLH